jgi:hypothetical protein
MRQGPASTQRRQVGMMVAVAFADGTPWTASRSSSNWAAVASDERTMWLAVNPNAKLGPVAQQADRKAGMRSDTKPPNDKG